MEIPFTETIPPTILFAPSWGPNNSLRVFGTTLVQELLNNFQVIVRPHVMSYYEDMDILDVLKDRFSENPHFFIDRNPDSRFVLSKASLVISDYSGIAFEYAFAYRRPVIFLNSQMKMFNENWSHYLPHPGIEVVNRDLIGVILPDCSSLLATIFEMLSHISIYQEKIDQNEHKMLFYKGIFAEKTYLNLKKVLEENNDENWCNSKN
jgi:YidC/Oxa1 family membrane protein insertase